MVHEMVDDMSLICVPPVVQLKLLIISAWSFKHYLMKSNFKLNNYLEFL
jgi:hypothetical protein